MVQMMLIFALCLSTTLVYGQTNSTNSLSDNHGNKQDSEQSVVNSTHILSIHEITNIILIALLLVIVILCIVLIYCVKTNAKRSHKQIMETMMQMQQYQLRNLSPTINTANTVPSEALTISKKELEDKQNKDKEFSITINRMHRAFTTPVPIPSPINIPAQTEIHGPFDIKRRERVNTYSNFNDLTPAVIHASNAQKSTCTSLERVASDPQIYEMEGKSIELETSLANDIKQATDSDESMYDNSYNENDIDPQLLNSKIITPRGDLIDNKSFVIDITQVSVSENNNQNDTMPPPIEYNFEEKSFEPLDLPNLPKDRLSQLSLTTQLAQSSNQYRTLEKHLVKKQRETFGDLQLQINLDVVQLDDVVSDSYDIHTELTDNDSEDRHIDHEIKNGMNLIRCEDRFD